MSKQKTIHYYVSGTVQGVWFRASTKDEADRLGLTGWVRNLPDGRVEVLASGSEEQLTQFQQWLKTGPEKADVTDLTFDEQPWEEHASFTVR